MLHPVTSSSKITMRTQQQAIRDAIFSAGLVTASIASSALGLILDSVIFVVIAFGEPDYILGQSIGKAWMVLLSLPLLMAIRHFRQEIGSERSTVSENGLKDGMQRLAGTGDGSEFR